MLTCLNIKLRCSSQAGNACNGYRTSNSRQLWLKTEMSFAALKRTDVA